MPHFAKTYAAGGLCFVSGQMAIAEDGTVSGDIAQQTTMVLNGIERCLADMELSRIHVAKMTVWLRFANDFAAFDKAYANFFGEHRPSRSTVVAELVLPGALIEIEALAIAADRSI